MPAHRAPRGAVCPCRDALKPAAIGDRPAALDARRQPGGLSVPSTSGLGSTMSVQVPRRRLGLLELVGFLGALLGAEAADALVSRPGHSTV
jgi:hypothetical protein